MLAAFIVAGMDGLRRRNCMLVNVKLDVKFLRVRRADGFGHITGQSG